MQEAALVVDRRGLARKLAHRPKSFVIFELLQNSWDESGVTTVRVEAKMEPGRPLCRIYVEDNAPLGFQDLTSVYTLFKDSKKAPDPTKRGRFELGEKLVAALALRMEVVTTKGTIILEKDSRTQLRKKLERGSAIVVDIRMNRDEFAECCDHVKRLIPPKGISTTFNDEPLQPRYPICSFETVLQTIRADDEGNLKPTARKARVDVYEPYPGEPPSIYEMGIPVVETGDKWHYDVQQRVPVNWERSNVPPSYLKALRVEVVNAMADALDDDDAKTVWVTQAIEDERVLPEAVKHVVHTRFGEDAVAHDPSDMEGTKISFSQGRQVVGGGTFSKGAWDNIRKAGALPPAGQVTPSPKPYGDGAPERVKPRDEWSDDMWRIATFAEELFYKLMDERCDAYIVTEPTMAWMANFQRGGILSGLRLCLNYGKLGKRWFAEPKRGERVLDLLLHEFAHLNVSDHLSDEFHKEVSRLGAKLANVCLDEPDFFRG